MSQPVSRVSSFGLFSWRPQRLQFAVRSPLYFLVVFTFVGVVGAISGSYLTVVLSTIEKSFGLKSKEAAWIYSGNEVTQILQILFLPFIGRVKRRPLWLAVGSVISALGILVIAVPQLTNGGGGGRAEHQVAEKKGPSVGFCGGSNLDCSDPEAEASSSKDYASMGIIFFGIFLNGIGNSLFFVFGVPYMDDNTKKSNSPFQMSLMVAARVVGPSIGYLLGSYSLKLYVNPSEDPGFDETDPR